MKIWDKVIKISAVLGAVIFILSSVFGGYSFINRRVIEKERKLRNETLQDSRMNMLIRSDSIMIIRFDQVMDALKTVTEDQALVIKQQKALNTSFKEHLKQAKKIDELINFYELQN